MTGNVANFVETEQIVTYLDFKLSFVQVCNILHTSKIVNKNLKRLNPNDK